MFFLIHKHTDDGIFDDFPKISDHFLKISKIVPKARRTFPNIFQEFPKFLKMSENFRRLPKTIEEDPMMFRWYTNYFKYNLRDNPNNLSVRSSISSHVMNLLPLGIGESLFTLFASLAYAIQFLMELQTYHFCILKGHSTINSASEYEPDILNIFCATRV